MSNGWPAEITSRRKWLSYVALMLNTLMILFARPLRAPVVDRDSSE